MKYLSECIFGGDCDLCQYFDIDGTCYCWLILVIGALLCFILVLFIFLISARIKRNKMDEEIETANYVKTYKELIKKQEEDRERQELLEAKENGEDGSEDILVQLVKEITDEERIEFGEVQFEAATSKDKVDEELQINFQKPKQQEENQ